MGADGLVLFAAEVAGVFFLLWFASKGLPVRVELEQQIVGTWHRMAGWAVTFNEWLTTALWMVLAANVFAGSGLDGVVVNVTPLDVLTLLLALLYVLPKVPHTESVHDFLLHHVLWFVPVWHLAPLVAPTPAPAVTSLQYIASAALLLYPAKAFAFEEFTYCKKSIPRVLLQTSFFYIACVFPFLTKDAAHGDAFVQLVNTPPAVAIGLLGETLAHLHRAAAYPLVFVFAFLSSTLWYGVYRSLRSRKVARLQKEREEEDELAAMNERAASGKVKRRKK